MVSYKEVFIIVHDVGSPHGLGGQAQYVAAARNEICINIGYRLSAFGFLASDNPRIEGNLGFKDQWLALEWIEANISVFGGKWNSHIYRASSELVYFLQVIPGTYRSLVCLQVRFY